MNALPSRSCRHRRLRTRSSRSCRTRFADQFAGAYWGGDEAVVLRFKDGVPAGAADLIAETTLSVRSESARYGEAEAEALSTSISADLESAGVPAVVALDARSERFAVTVDGRQDANADSVKARLAKGFPGTDFDVTVADGPLFTPWASQGGALASRPDLSHYCTIGFTVFVGTTRGLITAGHCENAAMNTYTDVINGGSATLTYQVEHQGGFGDMQWHTSNTNEVDDFYSSPSGGNRDVTGIASIAQGDGFLYWGLGSQTQYGSTVGWVNVDPPGNVANLTCFVGGQGGPGDSGGPVFIGNLAAGIIFGSVTVNGSARACFSKASRFDDGIGVFLATS